MKVTRGRVPITTNGVYSGISLETYHSAKIVADGEFSVSSSGLRRAWKNSMAHFYDSWAHNPAGEPSKPTRPMILGSAAHHLLLGEAKFNKSYVCQPLEYRDLKTAELKSWNNNAKPCIAWRDGQREAGRTILTYNELVAIKGMARSLGADPLIQQGALRGDVECSMIVKDKETGIWLKARPDVMPRDGDYVDLKRVDDVSDVAIFSALKNYGYHMQGALIWEIADQLGLPFETFTLINVEGERPHCVRAVPVHDDDLARGRMQCRLMIRKVADCLERGIWPGPGEGELLPLPLPVAERERIDARLGYEGKQ